MSTNNLYILILVILFIYSYYEIDKKITRLAINETISDEVVVELNKSIYIIDATRVVDHIHMLKNNMITLNKRIHNLNGAAIVVLNRLINNVMEDSQNYKTDNSFSDIKLQFGDHTDHNMFGNKLYNSNAMRSDIDDVQYEKYKILNVIMDLEIMMLLIKNDNRDGRIKLTNLHNLIRFLSSMADGKDYLTYDDIFGIEAISREYVIDDENTYNNFYTNDFGVNTRIMQQKVHKVDRSQDNTNIGLIKMDCDNYISDESTPLYESYKYVQLPKVEQSTTHNTQTLGTSGQTYVIKRDIIQNYVPFCDINKIIEDKKRASKHLIDSDARQSLRNDY
jgi:hypothetical protein